MSDRLEIDWFWMFRNILLEMLELWSTPTGLLAVAAFAGVFLLGWYTRRVSDRWDRDEGTRAGERRRQRRRGRQ